MKAEILGVNESELEANGAVNKETAEAMAAGARRRTGSTYALSVTGIAGPGQGVDLGVGLTVLPVPALADGLPVADDDGADERVRRRESEPALGELEGRPHMRLVGHDAPIPGRWDSGEETDDTRAAADPTRPLSSRLSRSVPELHRVHPRLAAMGSRTLTAGGELHPAPKTGS